MGKSPAFQFYVNDWLGSANIMLMTPAEEGAYIRLLAIEWGSNDCGLPNDDQELSILSRLGEGWFNGASIKIRKCFIENGNRIYNTRLLEERKKQEEWRLKSVEGGIKSGRVRKNSNLDKERWLNDPLTKQRRVVEPNGNSSSSFSSSKEKKIYKRKVLSDEEFLSSLKEKFLWLDFDAEIARMDAWLLAHPKRQKTRRFISNWFIRKDKPMEIKNGKSW